jgi:hypothetical protein
MEPACSMDIQLLYQIAGFVAVTRLVDHVVDRMKKLPDDVPVGELLALTDYLKQRYDVICLGDTDHRDLATAALLSSPDLAGGLEKQGYENIFSERPEILQTLINQLRNGGFTPERFARIYANLGRDAWLSKGIRRQLAARFAGQIMGSRLGIHAIDKDDRSLVESNSPLARTAFILGSLAGLATWACFPKSNLRAYVKALFLHLQVKANPLSGRRILDDGAPAEKIVNVMRQSPNAPAIVIYGAGHFNGAAEREGFVGMDKQLRRHGLNTAVVNLHADGETRDSYYREKRRNQQGSFQPPFADFIIRPKAGEPHIVFTTAKNEADFRNFCVGASRAAAPSRRPLAVPAFS